MEFDKMRSGGLGSFRDVGFRRCWSPGHRGMGYKD